jgi:periplasmic protein TonB
MFRLRTTVSLSLLALAIGVAGTAWLSTLTDQWKGPPGSVSARVDKVRMMLRRHSRPSTLREPAAAMASTRTAPAPANAVAALPMLTPIDMPPLPPLWLQRAVFADGRVVLRLTIDGQGHVDEAAVETSSGNAGLDDRALRTASRWRFAVPGGHPNGLSGLLVMRFDDSPAASL